MQRPPGESMLTVFQAEQGGRSGEEVEGGDEIQILAGITWGLRSTLRSLALTLKEMDIAGL